MTKIVKSLKNSLAFHRAVRQTYNELNSLSDRELWDIGMDRGSILYVAREHARMNINKS